MARTKLWLILVLIGFGLIYFHNAWFYSPHSGYDAGIHMIYTQIITEEGRIPVRVDTPESYNPPAFYFLSGQLARIFSPYFGGNLLDALKSWQILIALLMPLIGYLWYDIFVFLNPKRAKWGLFYLVWLLSIPVVLKMAPMYNIETPQLILGSVIVWYFIKHVLPKPDINKYMILGIFGGIILSFRIMSISLILSLIFLTLILYWVKGISLKRLLIYGSIFIGVMVGIGGQYYYFYRNEGVFDSGENVAENRKTPFFQRQPKSFYTDTFFRTMMRTPIRPYFPNRFMPIFYSTFWGDYWNYYRHPRYPLSAEEEIKFAESTNKVKISKERLNLLAWQNRINVIPTIIIILGMIVGTIGVFRHSRHQAAETFLVILFWTTWLLFIYTNIEFPNIYKGDTIKASYVLYAIPVLIYFATGFLIKLQTKKWLFFPIVAIVVISWLFNINFSYF